MSQQKQYDGPPSTFVNVKRVKVGEKDSKGRDKMTFTIGTKVNDEGVEVNDLNNLIDALLPLQGKQVNLSFHVGEAESKDGRTFPTAFLRVTEMIPKNQGKTAFVPKGQSRGDAAKARTAEINKSFKG